METFVQPKITGYRQLNEAEAALMNEIKAEGVKLGELVAKLRATEGLDQRWVSIGATDLQTGLMALTRGSQAINLSRTEFSILLTLIKRSGHVVTRRELEAQALPHSDSHALDVHIFNLRKKIGDGYVRTVRGVGFVLEAA